MSDAQEHAKWLEVFERVKQSDGYSIGSFRRLDGRE